MQIVETNLINYSPLSENQKAYLLRSFEHKINCAEGSVRSSKNLIHCLRWAEYLEWTPEKLHLASGSTLANAKLNIGDCNGFGIEYLFKGRCHWGKFKENEALYINTNTGEKVVIFAGGGKADSYKKILGNSYGSWYATEINEHYDCDDSKTSFIKVALARLIASKDYFVLWDLNPSSPNAKIYSDFIDKWRNDEKIDFNYGHFTLADNLSLTPERRNEIENLYDKNSVWYKRDILGIRCVSEGLIYQEFADKVSEFGLSQEQFDKIKHRIIFIECGVDFGGNKSKHTFVATAFLSGYSDIIILKSVRIENSSSIELLNNMFVNFCNEIYNKYGRSFYTNFDNAEPVLANGLQIAVNQNRCRTELIPALKCEINQRIRAMATLLNQRRVWYLKGECDTFVNAMCGAVWDNKNPDKRLDDGTSDIDTMDATEYSFEKHILDLLQTKNSFVKENI